MGMFLSALVLGIVGGQLMPVVNDQGKLEDRQVRTLSGREIKRELTGKSITVAPPYKRVVTGFGEDFFKDGRWRMRRTQRSLTVQQGKWWVEKNRLCAQLNAEHKKCRKLYRQSGENLLLINDFNWDSNLIPIMVY